MFLWIQEVETNTVVGGESSTQKAPKAGSLDATNEMAPVGPPPGQTGMEQVAKATPRISEQTHPFDGTWKGTVVIMNPSCRNGVANRFDLTLDVENGQIHGSDPRGRYAAVGQVTADGRLEGASLNNYLLMAGSISNGILRLHSRDCGARYALKRVETP